MPCLFEEDFERNKTNMRPWFLKRRYPGEIVGKEMSIVKSNFSRKIKPKDKKKIAYHPSSDIIIIYHPPKIA